MGLSGVAEEDVVARGPPSAGYDLGKLYVPLEDIERALAQRRDESLMKEVVRFSGIPRDLLARFVLRPLVLWRTLATPNHELFRFLDLARDAGLAPLVLDMPQDWFTPALNDFKRALGKLRIDVESPTGGGRGVRTVRVIDFQRADRQRISEIHCRDGTPLVDFHHGLCAALLGRDFLGNIADSTAFYASERPDTYYERFFALFTCFGVLAESYSLDGQEGPFTERVVLPAFEATIRRFGVPPIITPLLPQGWELDPRWDSYPAEVYPLALAARQCA